jgi:polyisoprenoid-binding protein YceI
MATSELERDYDGSTIPAAGTYAFDPAHSRVGFWVRHMMVAKVRGHFAAPAGTFTIAEDPTKSSVEVSIDWSTVETGEANRDAHLKSPDFFNIEKFPTITYHSTGVRHIKGDQWVLDGDLTVQDVTRSVQLDLEVNGVGRDPYGNVKVGFTVTGEINREDFGLSYNAVLETGGVMVGKEVHLEIDIEAALQQ